MVALAGIALLALYAPTGSAIVTKADRNVVLRDLPATVPADSPGPHVMVIMNLNSPDSMEIGKYYAKKRDVPRENILLVHTTTDETIDRASYRRDIESPGEAFLKAERNPIDYMVFTKGIPLQLADHGTSVDGEFATNDIIYKQTIHEGKFWFIDNPYFNKNEPFSRAKFGFSLACRLDGYTVADAEALVDRSLAAQPSKGPFLLNALDASAKPQYADLNSELSVAAKVLTNKGMKAVFDSGQEFTALGSPLAGYCSWGSNDPKYSPTVYHDLKFSPGAIAETFVSTSARTFEPTNQGQSLIADLVKQGVTGVKGYVSEPFTFALAHPAILFDRYTSGYNLAESFYMASYNVHWKEIVIGDPLCAPYHR